MKKHIAVDRTRKAFAYVFAGSGTFRDASEPRAVLTEAVGRIVRAVAVPVTADIEAGFGESAEEVARNCRAVLETGAVGINL